MRILHPVPLLLASLLLGCEHDGLLLQLLFDDAEATPDHLLITVAYPGELPRFTYADWSPAQRYLRINRRSLAYPPGKLEVLREGAELVRIDIDGWRASDQGCDTTTSPNMRRITHTGSRPIPHWQPSIGWVSPWPLEMKSKPGEHACALDIEPDDDKTDPPRLNSLAAGPLGNDAWLVGSDARMYYLTYLPENYAAWKLTRIDLNYMELTCGKGHADLRSISSAGTGKDHLAFAVGSCGTVIKYSDEQPTARWTQELGTQLADEPQCPKSDISAIEKTDDLNQVLVRNDDIWIVGESESTDGPTGVLYHSARNRAQTNCAQWSRETPMNPVCAISYFDSTAGWAKGAWIGDNQGHAIQWMGAMFPNNPMGTINEMRCIAEVIYIDNQVVLLGDHIKQGRESNLIAIPEPRKPASINSSMEMFGPIVFPNGSHSVALVIDRAGHTAVLGTAGIVPAAQSDIPTPMANEIITAAIFLSNAPKSANKAHNLLFLFNGKYSSVRVGNAPFSLD